MKPEILLASILDNEINSQFETLQQVGLKRFTDFIISKQANKQTKNTIYMTGDHISCL